MPRRCSSSLCTRFAATRHAVFRCPTVSFTPPNMNVVSRTAREAKKSPATDLRLWFSFPRPVSANKAVAMEAVYKAWKEASPTTSFPFVYKKKGVHIIHTWKDVREGLQRDGVSGAMHRSLAHITPSIVQSQLIKDEIRQEERYSLTLTKLQEIRSQQQSPRSNANGESFSSSQKSMSQSHHVPQPPHTARQGSNQVSARAAPMPSPRTPRQLE